MWSDDACDALPRFSSTPSISKHGLEVRVPCHRQQFRNRASKIAMLLFPLAISWPRTSLECATSQGCCMRLAELWQRRDQTAGGKIICGPLHHIHGPPPSMICGTACGSSSLGNISLVEEAR